MTERRRHFIYDITQESLRVTIVQNIILSITINKII